jgi:hypothetical protein
MQGSGATIEAELARRLEAARVVGSPNRIAARELREWAVDYLRIHDADVAGGDAEAGRPHSHVWMRDVEWEDALFAVLLFREDALEFLCGTGGSQQVRPFCRRDWFDDLDAMVASLRVYFAVPDDALWIDRPEAEAWLGRSW